TGCWCTGGSRVFESPAGEILPVPASVETIGCGHLPVAFQQINILVEQPGVRARVRGDLRKRQLLGREIWIGRRNPRAAQYHVDRIYAALAIIIEEEERLVLDDGTADIAAELVNVERRHRAAQLSDARASCRNHQAWRSRRRIRSKSTSSVVEERIRIHRPVSVKLKGSAVKLVAPGLGDYVDDCSSGPAEFGRVPVGVDLELLDRVLRKLVGSPPG